MLQLDFVKPFMDALQQGRWAAGTIAVLFLLGFAAAGCGVKKTVQVPVAPRIREAKTATLAELVAMLQDTAGKVQALTSTSVKITLTSGHRESGSLQEYRSAPAYILLERPDDIRVNVQNPLTKTTILELLSAGDRFAIWYPRDNKFFIGKNGDGELRVDGDGEGPVISARPIHIYDAIMPPELPLQRPDIRIAMREEQDATTSYYVLSLFEDTGTTTLRPLKSFWIERSEMVLAKEQSYAEDGRIAGDVDRADFATFGDLRLPLSVQIERPIDGYSLDMQFKEWRVNPELPDSTFTMNPPPGAQQVMLREKEQ